MKIRPVAGQRSSPDLCFATKSIEMYDTTLTPRSLRWVMMVQLKTSDHLPSHKVST